MRTIWKFELPNGFAITMPYGAEVIRVARQGAVPCLWAIVESDNAPAMRRFMVIGTGRPIPPAARFYIGTWDDDPFVWHLFELAPA